MGQVIKIRLSVEEREELGPPVGRPTEEAGLVRRARVILLSERGVSGRRSPFDSIYRPSTCPGPDLVPYRWRRWASASEIGTQDHAVPAETVDRIVQLAMSPPPPGRSRWTTRLLGKELDLTSGSISDVLRKNGPSRTGSDVQGQSRSGVRREGDIEVGRERCVCGCSPRCSLLA